MAEAAVSAQSNAVAGNSRLDRTLGASSRSGAGSLRPVSAVAGIQRDFSFVQTQTTQHQAATSANQSRNSALKSDDRRTGSGLLSNGVQLLLAETRTQEAAATFVAPASLKPALNSYNEVAAKVRETVRNNQAAAGRPLDGELSTASPVQAGGSLSQSSIPVGQTALGIA